MEVLIDKKTLEDIGYITEHIVEKFKDEVTDINALIICLEAILEKSIYLSNQMKQEDKDE